MNPVPIPLVDLQAQRLRLQPALDEAIARVVRDGRYIMGPEVERLETELSSFTGSKEVVSCASGTDALLLPLMALGVGPGDAVVVPSFTFAATAEVPALLGATPVFADVSEDTFTLTAPAAKAALDAARKSGARPRAIIPVDLFGLPAWSTDLQDLADAEEVFLLADAAQSLGARVGDVRVGILGGATATSFFPAKPLGCYGDGGAIFTDDLEFAKVMRSLRVHGQGSAKYDTVRVGVNARLDTLQAAILLVKLTVFEDELRSRQEIAARYTEALKEVVVVPRVPEDVVSAWAQYTVRVADRDGVADRLREQGIPSAVYYPLPLHKQPAYRDQPVAEGGAPVSELLAREVLSIPMHPYLTPQDQDRVIAALMGAVR